MNAKVGRPGGDVILREIASRLQKCVRDMDTASRFRSDRFGLAVPGIDDRDTNVTVAKRLQASLAAPYEFDGDTVPVGTQIGMATYPEHGLTVEELLSHAELSVHNVESMAAMPIAQMLLKFRH
ncbi:MAG: GGDEF domain-containing protein [Pseudomonadota bacterium]|nr:GGDEF domain-containing protein [Pseudomonadota bacterium]